MWLTAAIVKTLLYCNRILSLMDSLIIFYFYRCFTFTCYFRVTDSLEGVGCFLSLLQTLIHFLDVRTADLPGQLFSGFVAADYE